MSKVSLAKSVSLIFNPFILFAPAQVAYFALSGVLIAGAANAAIVVLLQAVLPFLLITFFIKKKIVSDFEITDQRERTFYFLAVSLLFLISVPFAAWLFTSLVVSVSLFISLVLIIIINRHWKISGHMTFDAILFSGLVIISPVFLVTALLLPLIGWSRIVLHKHTPAQIIGGTFLGISIFTLVFVLTFILSFII